jgi:hypothetical protein
MKKSDLKTGMTVVFRNLRVSIVMLDCVSIQKYGRIDLLADVSGGFMRLVSYNDDLETKDRDSTDFDIIKVYINDNGHIIEGETKKLIWERTPEKTYNLDGVEYSESTLRSLIKKATE